MEIQTSAIQASIFQGRTCPEKGYIVGYGAIIESLGLKVPFPETLTIITEKSKKRTVEGWQLFPPSYRPDSTLYKQLIFALKYEGVNLLVFKSLFKKVEKKAIEQILTIEPTGQYSRKIWFLYEWLMQEEIDVEVDLKKRKYIPLLDEKIQYTIQGKESAKHKILNNLPGTVAFCPLVRKTALLEQHIVSDIRKQQGTFLGQVNKGVLQRASAYLLLKDSQASFTIEGETPRNNRAARWGTAIGQTGVNDLSLDELSRLQQLVIESKRFTKMGIRKQQGFIGDRDRISKDPIPDHISAKHEDLELLMNGFLSTEQKLIQSQLDPVIVAAVIAFGFVFIHPFVDGNGRLHRYIIHHILAKMSYSQQGVIFPVSAAILDHIKDYGNVLESYSHPLLEFIEWESTADHNVKITNDTLDYYRYFDATKQAEFLYQCVQDTIENIIPAEVDYLAKFDDFKRHIDEVYEMPDDKVTLLVRFLEQGNGVLSKRVLYKEFEALEPNEVKEIEKTFLEIFEL